MIIEFTKTPGELCTLTNDELVWLADQIAAERQRRDICEHGVTTGDWCPTCNREYKRAAAAHEREEP